jgi:hypothetical protein
MGFRLMGRFTQQTPLGTIPCDSWRVHSQPEGTRAFGCHTLPPLSTLVPVAVVSVNSGCVVKGRSHPGYLSFFLCEECRLFMTMRRLGISHKTYLNRSLT